MGSSYRVYKPIQTEYKCLVCHGGQDSISPDVKKMIKDKYPKDMATGILRVGRPFRGCQIVCPEGFPQKGGHLKGLSNNKA